MARKTKPTARKRKAAKAKRGAKLPARLWAIYALALIFGAVLLRLAVNALGWVPVHFDEGQYWAYGHELAWGHFSKPPLVGWLILIATEFGGDTTFALRIFAVLAHAVIAWLVFLTGRRLFDGQTGFWAAVAYTAAPGVTASSMIMSTDPVMMAGWAVALYAWVRAVEDPNRSAWHWWALLGAGLGLAMLAKYTAIAFVGGAVGYALFSARGRAWPGVAMAVAVGGAIFLPNLLWQIANDFATVGHVAEDAAPAKAYDPLKFFEFFGAQFGVIGPVWFAVLLAALLTFRGWQSDWRMRLLAWQTFPLLLAMMGLALVTRAHPNWAAPAYVAGALLAARWLLTRDWISARTLALKVQAGAGVVLGAALYVAAGVYAAMALDLPRGPDPFKKMRLSEPFCERVLAAMGEEGAEVILSNDRRRLSECMFLGGIGFSEIAVWNPDLIPSNHHELVATLRPGDDRVMVLAVETDRLARAIAKRFETAREIESGRFPTHADRDFGFAIWAVQGFRDY
ncbi:MAG: glycosyltransferase family 39 protein [Pseudomonadota bacterium]